MNDSRLLILDPRELLLEIGDSVPTLCLLLLLSLEFVLELLDLEVGIDDFLFLVLDVPVQVVELGVERGERGLLGLELGVGGLETGL